VELPDVEVHVVPPQANQFAPAQPGLNDQHVQRLPPIAPRALQEHARLIHVEGRTLLPLGPRRVRGIGYVAGVRVPI